MTQHSINLKHIAAVLSLSFLALLVFGCSRVDAPTAPQLADDHGNLWNPQPGDQIVPGRDVPILRDGYWENGEGQWVNPFAIRTRVSQVIGPMGGTLVLGFHSLVIPPGAVSTDVTFSMAYASGTGVAVDCFPSPMAFAVPVLLTLSYAGTQYDVDDPPALDLRIFYMANDGSTVEMPSTVNPANMTVTAQVDHFSRYIIG